MSRSHFVLGIFIAAIASLAVAPAAQALPPANDSFDMPYGFGMTVPFTATGQGTHDGTDEPGEPDTTGGELGPHQTVWYSFVAPTTGFVRVNVCDPTTGVAVISVYTGPDVSHLTLRAGGENGCAAALPVTASQEYRIAVESRGDAGYDLNGAYFTPPANDFFANFTSLGSTLPISQAGTNTNASREAHEPRILGQASKGRTVWYRYTPVSDTTVTIDTCTTTVDTVVNVYSGPAFTSLVQEAEDDDSCDSPNTAGSKLYMKVKSGVTYSIQVQGFGETDQGTFTLAINGPTGGTLPTGAEPIVTNPPSPSNNNTPKVLGDFTPGTSVRMFGDVNCTVPLGAAHAGSEFAAGFLVTVPSDVTTTIYVQATNGAGSSPCSVGIPYTEDSTGPAKPVINGFTPASGSNALNFRVRGTAAPGSSVLTFAGPTCNGFVLSNGTAAQFANPGLALNVPSHKSTQFSLNASDDVGNPSTCVPFTYDSRLVAKPKPKCKKGKKRKHGKCVKKKKKKKHKKK